MILNLPNVQYVFSYVNIKKCMAWFR